MAGSRPDGDLTATHCSWSGAIIRRPRCCALGWTGTFSPPSLVVFWQSTLLSTAFLREHTRVLAGEDDGYLFEVLPDDGKSWGEQQLRNLLADPEFDDIKRSGGTWTTVGKVTARHSLVSMRDESSISQVVPVSGGSPYLLSAASTCSRHTDRAELRLRWLDGDGNTIGTAAESVVPGTDGSDQFLWRRAPDQAVSVSAELASEKCVFDEAALYQLS